MFYILFYSRYILYFILKNYFRLKKFKKFKVFYFNYWKEYKIEYKERLCCYIG